MNRTSNQNFLKKSSILRPRTISDMTNIAKPIIHTTVANSKFQENESKKILSKLEELSLKFESLYQVVEYISNQKKDRANFRNLKKK